MISKLHYITSGKSAAEHIKKCEAFCQAGGNWVQIRMKNVSNEIYLKTAISCREITHRFGAKLIVNDNIDVALNSNADGVHLGLHDPSALIAREKLGNKIIGGTANTWEDIILQTHRGVDYIGLGPFRFTQTKKNLSPIIGMEGYINLIKKMNSTGNIVPLIAIGGIQMEDFQGLLDLGVYGIAASRMLDQILEKGKLYEIINTLVYEKA